MTCKAILKTGKNKGNLCTYKAKFGKYCGMHKNYDPLKNEVKKKSKPKPNQVDIDKPINSNELDINDPNNLKYFWEKCKKCENDMVNKYREKIIIEIINNKDFYKIFENKKFKNRYSSLVQNLKREISSYCSEKFDKIVAIQKAGRSNSFDLLLKYLKGEDNICEVKVEFKYGVTTITDYPEFYSKYIWAKKGEFNIFKKKSYVAKYKKDVDNDKFISKFPEDIAIELTENKPDWDEYNLNDTNYKHLFQKIIYEYSKKTPNNDPYKIFINNQIKEFLKNTKITDIDFEKIQKIILDKQQDKIFLTCCEGSFNSEIINDQIIMKPEVRVSYSGNTLIFPCAKEGYEIHWLLRWKNHKGCAGPAWQISLREAKSN